MNQKSSLTTLEKINMKVLSICDGPVAKMAKYEDPRSFLYFFDIKNGLRFLVLYSLISTVGFLVQILTAQVNPVMAICFLMSLKSTHLYLKFQFSPNDDQETRDLTIQASTLEFLEISIFGLFYIKYFTVGKIVFWAFEILLSIYFMMVTVKYSNLLRNDWMTRKLDPYFN